MNRFAIRATVLAVLGVTALALSGCAGTRDKPEPADAALADVRAAYQAAVADPTVSLHGSDALQRAAQALAQAERSDAEQFEHYVYLARRHVQIAQAQARAAQAREQLQTLQQQVETRERTQPSAAAESLSEPALQAHRRAQQARDTALAAQIAATPPTEQGNETARRLAADLAALEVDTESTARGLVVVVEDPQTDAVVATELHWATKLAPVVAFLTDHPDRTVIVEGHTDNRMPLPQSLRQSHAKAQALRALLVRAGVPDRRIETRGMGPDAPIASNDTAEGRARNRRVELVIEPSP